MTRDKHRGWGGEPVLPPETVPDRVVRDLGYPNFAAFMLAKSKRVTSTQPTTKPEGEGTGGEG